VALRIPSGSRTLVILLWWQCLKLCLSKFFFGSSFAEIFDVDHFIDVLKDDISIVKQLPYEYAWSTREFYATAIRETRVKTAPVHASAHWYIDNVKPILQR